MKIMIKHTIFTVLLLVPAFSALAEAGGREDNSMTLVYLFLATCGLIIFLQLIPVFTLIYGMVKGIFGKKEEVKPAPVKHH